MKGRNTKKSSSQATKDNLSESYKEKSESEGSLELDTEDIKEFFNRLENENIEEQTLIVKAIDELPIKVKGDLFQYDTIKESKSVPKNKWRKVFPWDDEVHKANSIIFKHEEFKEGQLEVINAAKSNGDVLAIMPPKSGMKTAYKIYTITNDYLTFIITSSIKMAKQQTLELQNIGMNSILVKSNEEMNKLKARILSKKDSIKVVYLIPEVLNPEFVDFLFDCIDTNISSCFIIFEAQNASQLSDHYMERYKNIGKVKELIPDIPVLAFTNSVYEIHNDIIQELRLVPPNIVQGNFYKKSIFYEVRHKDNTIDDISALIKNTYNTNFGVVFCDKENGCENIARVMKIIHEISCEYYHDSMDKKDKKNIKERWKQGEFKVIITTSIKVLRSDIRFLIYYTLPKSIEDYLNTCYNIANPTEPLHSIIYYDPDYNMEDREVKNMGNLQYKQLNKYRILDYCEEKYICRRRIQAKYFNESISSQECNNACDNCRERKSHGQLKSFQTEAKIIVDFLKSSYEEKMTINKVINYLHAGNVNEFKELSMAKYCNTLKSLPIDIIRSIIIKLLVNRVIGEDIYETRKGTIAYLKVGKEVDLLYENKIIIKLMIENNKSNEKIESKEEVKSSIVEEALESRMKEMDIENIIERLLYVKNRLILRNNNEEKNIRKIFAIQSLIKVSQSVPMDLVKLKSVIKDKEWKKEEEAIFDKFAHYFLEEIKHYIRTYVEDQGLERQSEGIDDYKLFTELFAKESLDD